MKLVGATNWFVRGPIMLEGLLTGLIGSLAARYHPNELEFYLLDFKEGLEFAQFAPRPGEDFFLPHADTIGGSRWPGDRGGPRFRR